MSATISRRAALIGSALAGVAALVGLGFEGSKLLRHHAAGEYADLVNRLDEPERAAVIGAAILAESPPSPTKLKEQAAALRGQLLKRALASVIAADVADGRLAEARGWVLPQSLALLCVLAARPI